MPSAKLSKKDVQINTIPPNHDIEIYGRHTSYNVQKVLWIADELDIVYAHKQIGGRFGGTDQPDFLAMNPAGKIPVLRDKQRIIWESNTIIRYLADSYGNGEWISSDPYKRSQTDRWLDWSIDRFEKAFVGVFWGYYRTPPEKQNKKAIKQSVAECESCLLQLAIQLDNRHYITGDRPSVADVATGVFLHRLSAIDLNISMPDNIMQWFDRLRHRPAFSKWVMSDFTELKGRSVD